jgi:hypothetical protein
MMWGIGIITAIGLVGMLSGVIAAATVDQIHPSLTSRLLGVGFFLAMAAGIAATGFWGMRSGVLVDRDGITVRNGWRSRRVAWEAIDRFSVEPFVISTTGCVHLRDGEALATWGIQGPNRFLFPNSAEATEPIAQLNALWQQHRSHRTTPEAQHTC